MSEFGRRARGVASPLLILLGLALEANAGVVASEKNEYTLFKPTPRERLREMSTDRPDQTESPYTVDAGHVQVEVDFANATFDHDKSDGGDVKTEVWGVAPLNLKVGLLNNVDLQLMVDPYVHVRVDDRVAGSVVKASGFGDVVTRLKLNLWGNDSGDTALAVMPYVKWPLSASGLRNGKTEGGVIIPFGWGFAPGWALGLMTEFDFVDDGEGGRDTEFVNSITVGRDLTEKLGMYCEFFAVTSNAPGFKWQGQLDVGWTYALNDHTRLDLGCNFGVTKSSPDYNPFAGLSLRF